MAIGRRSTSRARRDFDVTAEPSWRSSPHDEPAVRPSPTNDELAALDALPAKGGDWDIAGRTVRITNPDKILFPARDGAVAVTKREMVRHYAIAAPAMLEYVADRPMNLNRFPNGIDKPGFWHKATPTHAPDWIRRWRYDDAGLGETEIYSILDSPAAIVWAANFGGLEMNAWTSTAEHPHQPTWALIDLDPGPASTFDDVVLIARLHRTALAHLGVEGGAKVTGKRGIQIWIPVAGGYTFTDTRTWVERLSRVVGHTIPHLVSWEWEIAKRNGLIRLDYTQNAINKTLVAPFSVRPAAGAPVSVPITWDELDDPDLRPDRWTVHTLPARLEHIGDPLAPLIGMQQTLPDL